jgi:adenine deaminase
METLSGRLLDLHQRRIYPAEITFSQGRITSVHEVDTAPDRVMLPGFVDAHIHIESSMLVPSMFARIAVRHGTVATVSDPHEIANVCGAEGVRWMVADGKRTPFKFHFGVPSCVPATGFETAGAVLDVADTEALLDNPDLSYLAEMMNWPGVLNRDPQVMAKIAAAHQRGKKVDGHAPGLRGDAAHAYIAAGISTDHECMHLDEALHKLAAGMNIIIREGSAARNFAALHPLFHESSGMLMFGSDDKHPDDLLLGHIDRLVVRALSHGYDLFDVLHAACVAPVKHYGMDVGLLRVGDPADFIVVDSETTFRVLETYIRGETVYADGEVSWASEPVSPINRFASRTIRKEDIHRQENGPVPVIVAMDGEIMTGRVHADPHAHQDILKLVVVNRYSHEPPAVAWIRGFGLTHGAIASSVAHDSHNVIAVGSDDDSLLRAINAVMDSGGGISAANRTHAEVLALPVGGLMSDLPGEDVARAYQTLDAMAKQMGATVAAPYMLLSFMALLVIPSLKLSDKGLFDAETFTFIQPD